MKDVAIYEFGHFRFDIAEHRLLHQEQTVPLTAKLFDLLLLLVEREGEIVEKEEIMNKIWPNSFVEEGNLAVRISELRKLLGESKPTHRFIETVPGRGYRFIAKVNKTKAAHNSSMGQAQEQLIAELEKVATSLAILPLVNMTDNPKIEYLSYGITENIINSLSQLEQLKVMAYHTVFRYKGRELDAQEIGRDLKVNAVLMGRLLQLEEHLLISIELIDTHDGSQIWGEQYNRQFTDIFGLQEQLAWAVSEKLRLKLTKAERPFWL